MANTGGMFQLALQRDGQATPWGFRLQGGSDHSRPLQVQRVCIGSPSEGNLQRGDTILKIGGQDTSRLTHQDAHDIIKHTGNVLNLVIQRGVPLIRQVSRSQPTKERNVTPSTGDFHTQPYRTTPLITPSLKVKRDTPVGSYLRYQPKGLGISASQMDSVMRERTESTFAPGKGWKNVPIEVLDSVTSAASGQGINPQSYQSYQGLGAPQQPRLPTTIQPPIPDLPPIVQHPSPIPGDSDREVVNRQYNCPVGLYSQANIAETMKEQTGLTPKQAKVVFKGVSDKKPAPAPKNKSEPGLPKVYSPSKSYTFNAVADEEWGNLQKKTFEEKRPPAPQIKTAPTHQKVGGMGMEKIAQSGTFMRLMHEVGI